MSFLRLLPTLRSNSYRREDPTLSLHVDSYGALYLTRNVAPFGPHDLEAGYVNAPFSLKGQLRIKVPDGYGRCRCLSIKVGLRTVCRLDMGPERGWEEDVIFPREEVLADEAGVWIEEGATE